MPNATVTPAYDPAVAAAGAATAAAATPAKAKGGKGKKGLIIGVVIALVIIAAAIVVYFTVLAPKPCYVVKQQVDNYSANAGTYSFERNDSGVLLKQTVARDGKTTSTDYKELAEGLSISIQDTGKYQVNSDGYLSSMEAIASSGKTDFSINYEYYSPGIIKTTTQTFSDGSVARNSYNEEGWHIESSSTDANGKKSTTTSVYEKSSDGKTMTRTVSSPNSPSDTVIIYELDENGNIVSKYKKDKPSERITYTYEKIDDPAKMVAASSRLKG